MLYGCENQQTTVEALASLELSQPDGVLVVLGITCFPGNISA